MARSLIDKAVKAKQLNSHNDITKSTEQNKTTNLIGYLSSRYKLKPIKFLQNIALQALLQLRVYHEATTRQQAARAIYGVYLESFQ